MERQQISNVGVNAIHFRSWSLPEQNWYGLSEKGFVLANSRNCEMEFKDLLSLSFMQCYHSSTPNLISVSVEVLLLYICERNT